jgi:phosphatidylglycerophosphate synthase
MFAAWGTKLTETHDRLRAGKDKVFAPLVDALPRGVNPDGVTWFRAAVTLAWLPYALLAPAWWHVALYASIYFLDLLDGALARLRGIPTQWGNCLDHVSDKFANIAVLLALYGMTRYVWREFEFFIVWDMVTALLIAVETRTGWQPLIRMRALAEFTVKTGLWLFLIARVFPELPFWS